MLQSMVSRKCDSILREDVDELLKDSESILIDCDESGNHYNQMAFAIWKDEFNQSTSEGKS